MRGGQRPIDAQGLVSDNLEVTIIVLGLDHISSWLDHSGSVLQTFAATTSWPLAVR